MVYFSSKSRSVRSLVVVEIKAQENEALHLEFTMGSDC